MEAKKSPNKNLEDKRFIFLQLGMILSLALVLLAFEMRSKVDSIRIPKGCPELYDEDKLDLPDITKQEKQEKELPIKPKPPTDIDVVEDTEVTDDLADFDASDIDDIPDLEDFDLPEEEVIIDYPFVAIPEIMPEFPGGTTAMYKWLSNNLKFTKEAKEANITGIVFVSFIVEPDGSLSDITIKRGLGFGLDEEVIRVIKLMPIWKPGKQGKRLARVPMVLPVHFKLRN